MHGVIGTLAIALAFVGAVGALLEARRTSARRSARSSPSRWDYANTVGVDAQLSLLLDPLSIFMALVVPASRR